MKPVKYILIITIILVSLAFIFTIPGCINSDKNDGNYDPAETSMASEVTGENGMASNPMTDDNGKIIVDGDVTDKQEIISTEAEGTSSEMTNVDETATVTNADTTSTTAHTIPNSNMEVDNEWALFLINNDHPLPDGYDFEKKTVYKGSNGKEFQMEKTAAEFMLRMIEDATAYGAPIGITSAYRSVEYQQQNFDRNVKKLQGQGMTYDEAYKETARNIAIPGRSEHNSGLAADILSGEHWSLDEGFENTRAFRWLSENAHKYGYILRYPKDKEEITGITYEPWHYRFVGIYHATKIKESGMCLEEYMETVNN